ncbi:hypothetical protein UFOVP274_53 [uncultured Caudovirales phage]|uniref:Uncharacterized protein n=1 Tax=uncultured Caudovirales phage TaxID=2100421 RepID=A0A6J5LNS3_9CAUD|nr:hypothetical protein UFOVP274_53 [uncultured Caudovirales phage]
MTRDDIIRMAREAGVLSGYESELFQRFAVLVAAAEREACAKVCDGWTHADGDQCAAAIRARGNDA